MQIAEPPTRHLNVASEILRQLGGKRFALMTGAKHFVACNEQAGALAFKLPARFALDGINYVKITLTLADEYEMEFFARRGASLKSKARREGVYCDQIRAIFRQVTGLDTSL
jgi:hypothetical protein